MSHVIVTFCLDGVHVFDILVERPIKKVEQEVVGHFFDLDFVSFSKEPIFREKLIHGGWC